MTIFSRTVYTNPSGQASDGNVSIGVINLQNLFRLDGGLDARFAANFNSAASLQSGAFHPNRVDPDMWFVHNVPYEFEDGQFYGNLAFGGTNAATLSTSIHSSGA